MIRAFLLSAGYGTRLMPLTTNTPKPLVRLAGKPIIAYAIEFLEKAGITEILINVHYFADQMEAYIKDKSTRRKKIHFEIQDERKKILGSGGAIKKAAPWLFAHADTALVMNADVFIRPNIADFLQFHQEQKKQGILTTLTLMKYPKGTPKYTAICGENNLITEFIDKKDLILENIKDYYFFPGIYLIEKTAVEKMDSKQEDFSILEASWIPLAQQKKLAGWIYNGVFQDLGTVEDLKIAESLLNQK